MSYIKYHTGLDATYLPTWCGDKVGNSDAPNKPTKPEILLHIEGTRPCDGSRRRADSRKSAGCILGGLTAAAEQHSAAGHATYDFRQLKELYPHYEYTDLQAHRCIVMIPYQVSVISFFEYYRLNVPVFVPSKQLLISWHVEHNLLWERVYVSRRGLWPAYSCCAGPPSTACEARLDR